MQLDYKQPSHLSPQTQWQFYLTSKEAWEGMLEAIKNAKHSIEFEQFLFIPDEIGRKFIEVLIQKAKEKVQIRCLFDSVGSFPFSKSVYPDLLEHIGVEIRFFNWLFPFSQGNKRIWYFRDHRRSLIIDDKIAFTGGVCISKRNKNWRETHVRMQGPIVSQIADAFEGAWDKAHHRTTRFSKESVMDMDGFTYSTHAPLPHQRYLYYRLIEAMRQAAHTIYITTPYFLPDNRMLRVLILARRRGVDVRILIPNDSNHPLVDVGSHTYFHQILSSGIKLYQYNNMIHAKTAVIDTDWALVGSMNLDNVSLRYNFEAGIVSTNKKFAREIESHFMEDIDHADELTLEEWNRRSWLSQISELLVWPFRKFL